MTGYTPIDLGLAPGDGRGDSPRAAGEKLNAMLAELFQLLELSPAEQAAAAAAIQEQIDEAITLATEAAASAGEAHGYALAAETAATGAAAAVSAMLNDKVVAATTATNLAYRYANDAVDADIPGAAIGGRGSKFWSIVAQGAAASISALSVIMENTVNRFFRGKAVAWGVADPNDRMLVAVTADGQLYAKLPLRVGAVANGVTISEAADGFYEVGLGTTPGIIPIGTAGAIDTTGDYYVRGKKIAWGIAGSLDRVLLALADDGTVLGKLPLRAGPAAHGLTIVEGSDGFFDFNLGTTPGVVPIGPLESSDQTATLYWNGQAVVHALGGSEDRPLIVHCADGTSYVPGLKLTGAEALRKASSVGSHIVVPAPVSGKMQLFKQSKSGGGGLVQITSTGNNSRPFDADGGTNVAYSTDRSGVHQLMCQPIAGGAERFLLPLSSIICVGDSLTQSAGATPGNDWPTLVGAALGRSAINFGIGGQTSSEIAARMNGYPITVTLTGNQIPAYGPVSATLSAVPGSVGLISASTEINVEIAGVPGRLIRAVGGTYTFARRQVGDVVAVAAGSALTIAQADYMQRTATLWMGQNDTLDSAGRATVRANIASIIARLPLFGRVAVLGLHIETADGDAGSTGQQRKIAFNNELAALYPTTFIDTHAALRAAGQARIDAGTASAQDITDHGQNRVQSYFLSDAVHLNNAGYAVIAQAVETLFNAKGW